MRSAGPSPSTITPRTITNGGFTASLGAGCSGCSGPTSSVLEWSSGSLRRGPHRGGPHGRATECFLPAVDLDSKECATLVAMERARGTTSRRGQVAGFELAVASARWSQGSDG